MSVEALGADLVIDRLGDLAGGIAALIASNQPKSLSDQESCKAV